MARQLDLFSPVPGVADLLPDPQVLPPANSPSPVLTQGDPPPASEKVRPEGVAPVPPGKRRLHIDAHVLDYALLRSKRRSIGFVISDDGLRVTAPKWVTVVEIESAIREKKRWIFTKLFEYRDRSARRLQPKMTWSDGETLPYLGSSITLRIRATQATGIEFNPAAATLTVCLPLNASEQQLKDRVLGWLQLEAKRVFAERLRLYADKLGVSYKSFALSSATTQWGSCTADGKIRLNWRLMHFALPLIDYVIAHELSHLREMNHSPRFWATVQSIFPEFETARRTLRDSAQETLPIF
ncbi:M48 family metallopeptidase [Glaciimonas immobilis]|nr:SprT family zinc-dependent metalloprotease [Glaciimonas immobilis]KAF3997772.1 M48 family metallopeptidase [Glaciimonas immobilis]